MNPEKFGRYEIKTELGRGGMATVYQAYDPRFEREVAIKVLPREMLHDPQFRARFEREAKTIAMLEHPAIVPVYDFGEEDGQPYFVMRYMTGGSLSDRIGQGPMPLPEAARILERIAPGLDEAHAKGIVHRDLKPGNILFDRLEEPYVSDFGIVKLADSQATSATGTAILGTPAYMSPEQAQGEAVDGRSDTYALGVILFEMLSGKPPYKADTPMGVAVKHITEPVPNIRDTQPNLPPAVENIIKKVMAKDKARRFDSCAELAAALSAVSRGESLEATTLRSVQGAHPSPPTMIAQREVAATPATQPKLQPIAPRPKKTGMWIGLGAAAFLLCAGVVTVFFIFKDKLLPAHLPVETFTTKPFTAIQPSQTVEGVLPPATLAPSLTPNPSETPSPSLTPTTTTSPHLMPGGADSIAFLNANNIWIMGVDGSGLEQLTNDGALKHGLQWLPDGKAVLYISGKCVWTVDIGTREARTLACFLAAEYLDAFQLSPDGAQVAVSLNRELYVVPFDIGVLSKARSRNDLAAMKGCFSDTTLANKGVRWSSDGQKIATVILAPDNGKIVEMIRVRDIHRCSAVDPLVLDTFPGPRFTMTSYDKNPTIPSFDWDGGTLFLLNSAFRNDGFGYLYSYNLENKKAASLDPLGSTCCYRDAHWSPDGSFIAFAYQDIRLGEAGMIQLFYIPYGTIGTGASYTPIPLPADFFPNPREKPRPALRPAQP